jgi:hypothetical protein
MGLSSGHLPQHCLLKLLCLAPLLPYVPRAFIIRDAHTLFCGAGDPTQACTLSLTYTLNPFFVGAQQ